MQRLFWVRAVIVAALTLSLNALGPLSAANAYEGMTADYQVCTGGAGKVANSRIVAACTRLIDNAAKKNELVGFFHALRGSANNDKRQNCKDAKIAAKLLKGAKMQAATRQLMAANCGAASVRPSRPARTARAGCMNANADNEIAEGVLRVGQFQDAAGRPQSAYILTLPVNTCLAASDPDERVDQSQKIHIFASANSVHRRIGRFVGKTVLVRGRPMAAHTAHHHAAIIMDIASIDTQ